ncbi:MAG: S-layer homology domain-containing protein [Clostridiales Family XIII bacterium]|jgi:hypothetical protein|nr:S-layer homology domain-containing protein [Clostridiales Family XIII bacterium]
MDIIDRIGRRASRLLAFALALALLAGLGPAGFAPPAHAADGDVSVRIEAGGLGVSGGAVDAGTLTLLPETALDYGALLASAGAATVSALQAIDAALSGAGLAAAELDRGNYDMITTVGGVALPGSAYWAFYINDASAPVAAASAELSPGDRVVLYISPYDGGYNDLLGYAYFRLVGSQIDNNGAYGPVASVRLGLYTTDWTGKVSPVTDAAVKYDSSWGGEARTDSVNGVASFELYPYPYGASSGIDSVFEFYSDAPGISRPYCRIVLTTGGDGNITALSSSQPEGADTSLASFTLEFPGMATMSALSSVGDAPLLVGAANGVTLSAVAGDAGGGALIALRYREAGGDFLDAAESGSISGVWLPVSEGENTIEMTVKNGGDFQIYILKILSAAGGADVRQAAAALLDGLAARDISHSYSLSDWMLGARAAGRTPSEAGRDAFLTQLLASVPVAAGPMAKAASALSSLGIDARMIPDKGDPDSAIDLIARIDASDVAAMSPIYEAPYVLSLYDTGIYSHSGADTRRADLIDLMLDSQNHDGSFGGNIDETALMLPALSPYYGADGPVNSVPKEICDAVTEAVDKALVLISAQQLADGGFDGTYGRNSNTTAVVIAGLSALGIDAHADPRFVKNGRSLVDHLLTFRTADGGGLGYQSAAAFDDYASAQGYQALAVWKNLTESKGGSLYGFWNEVAPYTAWPDADLLTGILLTPPSKTYYDVGQSLDAAGMKVVAEYNSDRSNRRELSAGEYATDAPASFDAPGPLTVKVSYRTHTASFVVYVNGTGQGGGSSDSPKTAGVVVTDDKGKAMASASGMIIEPGATSPLDLLKTVMNGVGKSVTLKAGGYVASIDGLGEFDRGPNSGWIYLVNGSEPTQSASVYRLYGGESVHWKYTLDYTEEPGSSAWSGSGGQGAAAAAAEAGGGASGQTVLIGVDASMDDGGKAFASVAAEGVSGALAELSKLAGATGGADAPEKAVEISVRGADGAKSVETALPAGSLAEIAKAADRLILSSALGSVSMDAAAMAAIAAAAPQAALTASLSLGVDDPSGGGRPAGAFSLRLGDTAPDAFGAPVLVSIPYALADGEDPSSLLIRSIEGGEALPLAYSFYDEAAKSLKFLADGPVSFAVSYARHSFADVEGHWAEGYIGFLAARGGVRGVTETGFDPQGTVLRAQLVQMLYNISGMAGTAPAGDGAGGESAGGDGSFADVPQGAWYAEAVAWAAARGIVVGEGQGEGSVFRPGDPVTREDIAVILDRYLKGGTGRMPAGGNAPGGFADGDGISPYAAAAVERMQGLGIMEGSESGDGGRLIRAKESATRAETAKMLATMLKNSVY